MSDTAAFVLERHFSAPPELVWKVWNDQEHQSRWYGSAVETIIHQQDARTGGSWLVEMKGDGWSAFQRADYVAWDPPSRLEFLQSVTDAGWNVIANPAMPDWPLILRAEILFEVAEDGGTDLRLLWEPYEATAAEAAFFAASLDGMAQGWRMGLDILDGILAEIQT